MRALVLTGKRRVEVQERPVPSPGPGEVLLRVNACGICGSDVHGFLGEEPRRLPGLCLGHECVGELASAHPSLETGRRVAVNPLMIKDDCPTRQRGQTNLSPDKSLLGLDQVQGAFAEYTVLKAENVAPLAESVSDELACLIEPLACAVHLLSLAPPSLFARTILFGMGPLGAMALIVANRLGYRVEVAEPSAGRREMALALGATAVHDPLAVDWREGVGPVPLTIDCTGVSPARHDALRLTEPGGTVLLLGTTAVETTVDFRDVVRRELRLQASYGFTPRDFAAAKALIEAGAVPVERWLQCRPLEAGQSAFESLTKPLDDVLKVVLKPR